MFTNGQNIALPLQAKVKKIVHKMETYWLSSKEKVLGAAVSKEDRTSNDSSQLISWKKVQL